SVSVTGASSPEQGGQPNEVHSYSYDYRGNLVAARDPDPTNDSNPPVVHNFFYDDRNRLIQVQPPTGSPLQVSYDAWQKTVTDPDGKVKKQFFDGAGQLALVQEFDGAATATTAYKYDGVGRLAYVIDADGKTTSMSHDGQGHRTSIIRPGSRTWTYSYD